MVWYEADVRQLEASIKARPSARDKVVFYGSSSIRLWATLAQDFPHLDTLNMGFGGSTLAACAWFFERLILPVTPRAVVFYAGDNDLGDGRHPEEVYLFFCALADKMKRLLPGVPLYFLSIKISIARWSIAHEIRLTNELIRRELEKHSDWQFVDMTTALLDPNGRPSREFFKEDGLHLSPEGYRVWAETFRQQARIFNDLFI